MRAAERCLDNPSRCCSLRQLFVGLLGDLEGGTSSWRLRGLSRLTCLELCLDSTGPLEPEALEELYEGICADLQSLRKLVIASNATSVTAR